MASCGRFTLEDLFAGSASGTLELARAFVEMLHSLGDVQVLPQKSRLVAVARVRFAGRRLSAGRAEGDVRPRGDGGERPPGVPTIGR